MAEILFAIDPGTTRSAWLQFNPAKYTVLRFGLTDNDTLRRMLHNHAVEFVADTPSARLIVEVFKSYGNVIGDSVLETCVWIGRFIEAAGGQPACYNRRQVVTHICNNPRAGDKQVRQALIDRFPGMGAGRVPSIGTAGAPGPLYGITRDVWAALALAVTHAELNGSNAFLC